MNWVILYLARFDLHAHFHLFLFHLGLSGGGYCDDDKNYDETISQRYFSNCPFAHSDHGPL